MSRRVKDVNLQVKGFNLDLSLPLSSQGNKTFALNSIKTDFQGNKGNESCEPGNLQAWSLPEGYLPLGDIPIDRDRRIILSKGAKDEIGIVDSHNNYSTLVSSSLLGFDLNYPIKGVYRQLRGCEIIIYYTDNKGRDKYLNIDRLQDFTLNNYTPEQANALDAWDINSMFLQSDVDIPFVSNIEEEEFGGSIERGLYSFAIEILDGGLNRVGIYHSVGSAAIKQDSDNDIFVTIDGGSDQPVTNKALRLTLENLDTRFEYYRVWAIRKVTGDGLTVEVYKKNELNPITTDTDTYIFTGIQAENGDVRSDIEEITVNRAYYETSADMQIINERLARINVGVSNRDYSEYQRTVNDFNLKYTTSNVPFTNASALGNSKNAITYFNRLSFMSDEVYALGIVFVYASGLHSPAFHLPGRAAEVFDTELLTVVAGTPASGEVSEDNVAHLGLTNGDTVERWKVFNTADTLDRMAYWEAAEATYPLDTDCNGEYIYGTLAGTPIRHHKFPNRAKITIATNDVANKTTPVIGVELEDVVYPDDDIVGHYIVVAPRDNFNRTVLDKGYFGEIPKNAPIYNYVPSDPNEEGVKFQVPAVQNPDTALDSEYGFYLSPKSLMLNEFLNGTHISLEAQVQWQVSDQQPGRKFEGEYQFQNPESALQSIQAESYDFSYAWFTAADGASGELNRKLDTTIHLNRPINNLRTIMNPNDQVDIHLANENLVNKAYLFKLEDNTFLPDPPTTPLGNDYRRAQYLYGSIKVTRDIHPNLYNIPYYKGHSNMLTLTGSQEVYAGDITISPLAYTSIFRGQNESIDPTGWNQSGTYTAYHVYNLPTESEINMGLRDYNLENTCDIYYKPSVQTLINYTIDKCLIFVEDETYELKRGNICPDYYQYNKDYTFFRIGQVFQALSPTYDYCERCTKQFVNRCIWSPESKSDEISDVFRINLVNDYVNIGTDPLTNIYFKKNTVLITSTLNTFLISPNPRAIETDIDTVYLGTGDFMGIPANQLVVKDIGYAGNQGRFNNVQTEFGLSYVDQRDGKVFNFNESLEPLSMLGIEQWFRNELPSHLERLILQQGQSLKYNDVTTNPETGVGIRTTYDPRHKRLILHKRDYTISKDKWGGILGVSPISNKIYYNPEDGLFYAYIQNTSLVPISIGDPDWFINKSWTLSYDYAEKEWVSFHSYLPSFMYYDINNFYSFDYANTAWRHVETQFLSFYGKLYPFIVEVPIASGYTTDIHAVHWYSRARKWIAENEDWKYEKDFTFNKLTLYNKEQSTGEVDIVFLNKTLNPYGFPWSNTTKEVVLNQNLYKVSELRDISTDTPTHSYNWNIVQSFFNQGLSGKQGYIDKLPVNVNYTTNQHQLSNISGKYALLRLGYIPTDKNIQLIIDLIKTKNYHQDE
jgi:hypothetical protein